MNIFKFLFGWIGKLFNSVGKLADKVLPVVITVTNNLKYKLDSPVADILVSITPTTVDDILLAKLREALPKVLEKTAMAQKFLAMKKKMTDEQLVQAIIEELKKGDLTDKQKFWVEFSGMLTYYLSDGKLTVGEAISLSQYWYNEKKERA